MKRSNVDHDARRIEIAEAACDTLLEVGLEGTRLKDIAESMGYTTGVLQHYFKNKEELLLFAKNLLFDRSLERMQKAADKYEGIDRIIAMAKESIPTSKKSIAKWRLLTIFDGHAIGHPALMRVQNERNILGVEIIVREIEKLQNDGILSDDLDPNIEGFGLVALMQGMADHVILSPKTWKKEHVTHLTKRYISRMLDTNLPK